MSHRMQVDSRNWKRQGNEFSSRPSIRNTAIRWLIYSSDTLVSLASYAQEKTVDPVIVVFVIVVVLVFYSLAMPNSYPPAACEYIVPSSWKAVWHHNQTPSYIHTFPMASSLSCFRVGLYTTSSESCSLKVELNFFIVLFSA